MNNSYDKCKDKFKPKIYIACLAAYNAGYLHGEWVDATLDVEEIQGEINEMLASSPIANAEEWAIHDYDDFGNVSLGEYPSLSRVVDTACFIAQHGTLGIELLTHYDEVAEAEKALDEYYLGVYASVEDYAQELTEDTTKIPEHLQYYIDYEAMARDMELNGDIFTIETGYKKVHIFLNF
ncbi:antirestriction protein ArdA [Tolypothrix sp. PCC 7910]|uniref:antirestriction protein ArdA n=1 Tax=Tolypothrix sp. PCC 7910 TaxID=2099387 RepID=UPI0014278E41|nr:antirestriction protein ArdA [Tolypothrix sp. PCC 7910]QIR36843.1 antirestriction protein ArdA [Tolypothrix sp. PCC 7910]